MIFSYANDVNITSFAISGSDILVTTSTDHSLEINDDIVIIGTGITNVYDGQYKVLTKPSATTFTISGTFTVTGTGQVYNGFLIKDENILYTQSTKKRSVKYKHIDMNESEHILGTNKTLDIDILLITETQKVFLNNYFNSASQTLISNYDEVITGETYSDFNTNIIFTKPKNAIRFKKITDVKDINYYKCSLEITFDTIVTGTK